MNYLEWIKTPWQTRNQIKRKFPIKPSQNIKTVSANGNDYVEDDGVRDTDLSCIAHLSFEEVMAVVNGTPLPKVEVEIPKVEITEVVGSAVVEVKVKKVRRKKNG